jgi:hypothetical protein
MEGYKKFEWIFGVSFSDSPLDLFLNLELTLLAMTIR